MNLRSLIPLRDRSGLARPEANPFGSLQREVDRLFEDTFQMCEQHLDTFPVAA